jgi:hypothetical protein
LLLEWAHKLPVYSRLQNTTQAMAAWRSDGRPLVYDQHAFMNVAPTNRGAL